MDSNKDGYISVLDVEINSLEADVLTVLESFLLGLADNNLINYTFP